VVEVVRCIGGASVSHVVDVFRGEPPCWLLAGWLAGWLDVQRASGTNWMRQIHGFKPFVLARKRTTFD